jgi:hypothetical protein
MLFCFVFDVMAHHHESQVINPCQGEFFSNFVTNCSNTSQHICTMDEWRCVIHGQHHDGDETLSGACLGNSFGCLLTVNQQTGQCFGHCADQNHVVGLGIIMILGLVLFIIVLLIGCAACCCCCGCCLLTGHKVHKWMKKRKALKRRNDFHPLPDGGNGQQLVPMMPVYPMPGAPIQGNFGQFVRPDPEQTEA